MKRVERQNAAAAKQYRSVAGPTSTERGVHLPNGIVYVISDSLPALTPEQKAAQKAYEHDRDLEVTNVKELISNGHKDVAISIIEADSARFPEIRDYIAFDDMVDSLLVDGDGERALRALRPLLPTSNGPTLARVALALTYLNTFYPDEGQVLAADIASNNPEKYLKLLPSGPNHDAIRFLSNFAVGIHSSNILAKDLFLSRAWTLDVGNPWLAVCYGYCLDNQSRYSSAAAIYNQGLHRASGDLNRDLQFLLSGTLKLVGTTRDKG